MPDSMLQNESINWMPYTTQEEASICIADFVNNALSRDVGIIWCSNGGTAMLRPPAVDSTGCARTVTVQWCADLPYSPDETPVKAETSAGKQNIPKSTQPDPSGIKAFIAGNWTDDEHMHLISATFDAILVVGLFIPGVGEAEMAVEGTAIVAREAAPFLLKMVSKSGAALKYLGKSANEAGVILGAVNSLNYEMALYFGGTAMAEEYENSRISAVLANLSMVLTGKELWRAAFVKTKIWTDMIAAKSLLSDGATVAKAAAQQIYQDAKDVAVEGENWQIAKEMRDFADSVKTTGEALATAAETLTNGLRKSIFFDGVGGIVGSTVEDVGTAHHDLAKAIAPKVTPKPPPPGNFKLQVGAAKVVAGKGQ